MIKNSIVISITGPADVTEGDTTTPYTVSISQAPTSDLEHLHIQV